MSKNATAKITQIDNREHDGIIYLDTPSLLPKCNNQQQRKS